MDSEMIFKAMFKISICSWSDVEDAISVWRSELNDRLLKLSFKER